MQFNKDYAGFIHQQIYQSFLLPGVAIGFQGLASSSPTAFLSYIEYIKDYRNVILI